MVLDTLAETRPNIKRLTLEKPQKQTEILFDPERDISPQDWEAMLKDLSRIKESDGSGVTKYYQFAVDVKLLSPERYKKLEIDDALWEHLKKSFGYAKEDAQTPGGGSEELALILSHIKLLFPKKIAELYPNINVLSEDLNIIKNDLSTDSIYIKFIEGMPAHIITNGESSQIPTMKDAWDAMKTELNIQKEMRNLEYPISAMELKIMYPIKFRYLKLGTFDWEDIKVKFNRFRNPAIDSNYPWDFFARLAVSVYILAAESVKISDQGLEIIMPKPKEDFQEVTPLPEQRRF